MYICIYKYPWYLYSPQFWWCKNPEFLKIIQRGWFRNPGNPAPVENGGPNIPFFIGFLPSFWFMGCPRAHPPYRYPKSQVPPDGAYREVQAIGQDSPLKTWWFYGIFMGGIMGYTICWLWLTLCHGKSMKITMLLTGKPPISIRAMENTMANC